MTEQNINITLDRGSENHVWTVLGTLLACGAVGMIAWAISNAGMLDLAATGLTVFFFQLVQMMMKVGLLVLPQKKSGDFAQTSGFISTALREFHEYQARSPIWRLAAMALAYTVAFMIARWGLSVVLGVFNNIWIAGGAAAFVAALIVSPNLFRNLFGKARRSGLDVRSRVPADDEQ